MSYSARLYAIQAHDLLCLILSSLLFSFTCMVGAHTNNTGGWGVEGGGGSSKQREKMPTKTHFYLQLRKKEKKKRRRKKPTSANIFVQKFSNATEQSHLRQCNTHKQARTHACTHTHTRTHARTHASTHTHYELKATISYILLGSKKINVVLSGGTKNYSRL